MKAKLRRRTLWDTTCFLMPEAVSPWTKCNVMNASIESVQHVLILLLNAGTMPNNIRTNSPAVLSGKASLDSPHLGDLVLREDATQIAIHVIRRVVLACG